MALWKAGRCLLKDLRIRQGMTQEVLSENSGVSRSVISALENNRYLISDLSDAKSLAVALRCRIDDLYEWIRK